MRLKFVNSADFGLLMEELLDTIFSTESSISFLALVKELLFMIEVSQTQEAHTDNDILRFCYALEKLMQQYMSVYEDVKGPANFTISRKQFSEFMTWFIPPSRSDIHVSDIIDTVLDCCKPWFHGFIHSNQAGARAQISQYRVASPEKRQALIRCSKQVGTFVVTFTNATSEDAQNIRISRNEGAFTVQFRKTEGNVQLSHKKLSGLMDLIRKENQGVICTFDSLFEYEFEHTGFIRILSIQKISEFRQTAKERNSNRHIKSAMK